MENHFWSTENFFKLIGQQKTISGQRKTISDGNLFKLLGRWKTISGRRKTF